MKPILAGIETEYGLWIEGRGAENQVEDAMTLVRAYPGEGLALCWDYRFESPRADLRGFVLDQLAVDPEDKRFERRLPGVGERELRVDWVLANGARFYNDHGHPEYATPECWSLDELVRHDLAGEYAVRKAGLAFEAKTGLKAKLYKNNTDYHGASYGTHESYLVPREIGFERLFRAVTPILCARTLLCGAGKVGSERGGACDFQLSQRADFFMEATNAETLYKRPVFNTRDEPHADPAQWIRLHVIAGDANRLTCATKRKVGLVKLALVVEMLGQAPSWRLQNPVQAFQAVSREGAEARIELEGPSWSTPRHVLESYLDHGEQALQGQIEEDSLVACMFEELRELIQDCRQLLEELESAPEQFAQKVDWAAKRAMLEAYRESEGASWREPIMQALDLEYHNIDPEESLFNLLQSNAQDGQPSPVELEGYLSETFEPNRAWARGLAIQRFKEHLAGVSWGNLTFEEGGQRYEVPLRPEIRYPRELARVADVKSFRNILGTIA